ncbi:MAG: nuclear transport factor 2 family protein [Sphingomonadales bacterium]|nr:nuclear transport factor 2 family protein [Sphingomonadales bacterium]
MADDDAVLAAIDAAYAARKRGDKEALAAHFAPGATFRLVGRSGVMGFDVGPVDALDAIGQLIDLFTFHTMERLHVAVSDHIVFIHWRVDVSARGGERDVTEICDIWRLDDDLKTVSLVEFADTASMAQMAASAIATG